MHTLANTTYTQLYDIIANSSNKLTIFNTSLHISYYFTTMDQLHFFFFFFF